MSRIFEIENIYIRKVRYKNSKLSLVKKKIICIIIFLSSLNVELYMKNIYTSYYTLNYTNL